MLFSGKPSTAEQDHESPQDAWSSAFPPNHDQPFDRNSFGSMDRPASPLPDHESVRVEHLGTSPPHNESFAASSLNDEPFGLDPTLSSTHNGPTRNEESLGMDHSVSPSRGEESYETGDLKKPSQQRQLYRAAIPGETTPYLGLRARLAQIPINRWTILLLLVLARMLILFDGLGTNLINAQQEASAACSKVEDIGSTLASMPYYLSGGVNELVAMGITDTVRGLINVLMLILSAVVEIIMFVIDLELGTITCVADSFVHGLITAVSDVVNGLVEGVNDAIEPVVGFISNDIDGVVKAVGDVLGVFAPDLTSLENDVATLSSKAHIDDSSVISAIANFNSTIPTFDDIEADIQTVIGLPFNTLKTLVNESFGNWTMDQSVFPTASKETLTFCTGNDTVTKFFDVLFTIVKNAKIIAIIGLVVAAILAAVFMTWWEIKRYRRTVVKAQTLDNREPLDVVYIAGRPLTAGTGLWISEKVSKDPKRQMLVRWCVACATTYTALFVLSLAVAGAFSVLCQFFVMRAVQKEAPALAQEVGGFVEDVVATLESASTRWANHSNQAILDLQDDINDKVLIYVVEATTAINNTINVFENSTETTLRNALGNSPIGMQVEGFVAGLLDCILFDKLAKIQDALTWVHDNAQVNFPEFPTNLFSAGVSEASGSNSSLTSILAAAGTATADDITGAVNKVIAVLQNNIIQEGLISLVLLLVYIAYVFFAVAQVALRMCCTRERETEQQRYPDADESQRRYTMGPESQMTRTPRSVALSAFSDFDVAEALGENEKPAVEVVQSPAASERVSALKEAPVHVEVRAIHEEDLFGDETYAAEGDEHVGMVRALRDSRDFVDNRSLTPRRAHFWTEDGNV